MKKEIKLKRIYEDYSEEDGTRILVDRLWPRGMKKENAKIDFWMKEIAPSSELRKWYHQNIDEWDEFRTRYIQELNQKKNLCKELLEKSDSNLTLLFSVKNVEHNHAIILKNFLEKHLL